jgi:hypothetical protein
MLLLCQTDESNNSRYQLARLVRVRVVKGTVNSYLAGIRQLHGVRGMDPLLIRDGFIS